MKSSASLPGGLQRFFSAPVACAAVLALLVLSGSSELFAANPPSGTFTAPTDDQLGEKARIVYTGGPLLVSNVGPQVGIVDGETGKTLAICGGQSVPGACDIFVLTIDVPSTYWDSRAGNVGVRLTWTTALGTDPSLDDIDLYVLDAEDNVVGSGATFNPDTGQALETTALNNIPRGVYRVVVSPFVITSPANYSVELTFNLTQPPPVPPATPLIFDNFQPPADLGNRSGEPSLGVNLNTGKVMFQAVFETLRVTFDDTTVPATDTWEDVSPLITSVVTADPILYTDRETGRTFVSQLTAACSLLAFTNNDGVDWFQNPLGCGLGTIFDHQTIGGGPFAPGLSSVDPVFNYPHDVYYCAQAVADASCAISVNGGITFGPGVPVYTLLDCGGLHGHIQVAADGTTYLPNSNCFDSDGDPAQGIWISTNNGLSWTLSAVKGSGNSLSDPGLGVSTHGTLYFAYENGGHTFVAVSTDRGQSWSNPTDLSAPVLAVNAVFPSAVAGDDDRAAVAFLGTQQDGDLQAALFPGVWRLYVALTYDRGQTWTTYDATPGDPVQRGCIWMSGGDNPCRNLLDFMGITMDKRGRVLVGYADGCIQDCINTSDRGAMGFRTEKATIARQSAELGLLAAFDSVLVTPPGTPVLTGQAGNQIVHLSWTPPSNGGSLITSYRIYRGTASGGEAFLTAVGGGITAYDDTSVANDTTYFYQLSAVNSAGEGARSNELTMTPRFSAAPSAPQQLKALGKQGGVFLVWHKPSDTGTAPLTHFRVYRGTASGLESFLAETGDARTHYDDSTAVAGVTYFYRITAVNAVGESASSNEASAAAKQ